MVVSKRFAWLAWGLVVGLCLTHSIAIWVACGGWAQLSSAWPLAMHDHPLHFHSSTLAPAFFAQTGTNAGYDPYFMAGYPKSVIFPESSALYDTAAILTGGRWPAQTHKAVVFLATAAIPWLIAAACLSLRLGRGATLSAVLLFLIYAWSDGGGAGFPLNYALYGMTTYLLVVPLGMWFLGAFAAYLKSGGWWRWAGTTALGCLVFLTHATSLMVVVPAALVGCIAQFFIKLDGHVKAPINRHVSVVIMAAVVALANAFWWLPGLPLAAMRSASSHAFIHGEGPWVRLGRLVLAEPVAQAVLLSLGLVGLVLIAQRDRLAGTVLTAYAALGLAWGYLASAWPALDFLQPGRHTFVMYTALAIAGGAAIGDALGALRARSVGLAGLVALGAGLLMLRLFANEVADVGHARIVAHPFLSSAPSIRLKWVLEQVRANLNPGDRLLYEESGTSLDGVPDPFEGGRFSGLLPHLTGVELLGGPYLQAAIKTNFTQFGQNRLFGKSDWDAAFFRDHAEMYRPNAILCWSPHAVAFCEAHPELVEILARSERNLPVFDPATQRFRLVTSVLIFGRVRGFEGKAIRGRATTIAQPGRIRVEDVVSDELDGLVVLGYHHVPRLRATPAVRIEAVKVKDDPVPFIGLRGVDGPVELRMDFLK